MSERQFQVFISTAALLFFISFCMIVVPALMDNPNIVAAFAAGFVNPFATGYSIDVIACWVILAIWIVFEANTLNIRHGWICLLLGVIPGVAVGFAGYLLLRLNQLNNT